MRILETNSGFLLFCLGLTHTQMQSLDSQPRSGSEERVLGLVGGKEGRLRDVNGGPDWETMG